ncbi:hypothetical protein QBC37DRAFT_406782 [Rhypophila decipiens]|uniref:Uncharacterized protein n=1 Tax=Rhypophila decipiens TaxID=261697 RepID=A0AAN7B1H5_9PEZI|nr:hypothetical protein QBC37DRAFT_406782 [Rhypophila decipiens]
MAAQVNVFSGALAMGLLVLGDALPIGQEFKLEPEMALTSGKRSSFIPKYVISVGQLHAGVLSSEMKWYSTSHHPSPVMVHSRVATMAVLELDHGSTIRGPGP